ncbi:XrtA system polysaccharide deacetylase [Magnetospira sp. QH-2]|uniref:XrtA system polysaccharide deacetylase n=1 Tax=Magnetospira sp. (strain QH-2) TaxID=1288970 RepID=UPI0003E80B3D|nr:XrtA system polysaccharide deacetylase [Magnetospira sp. QH-2]CCQ72966.1 putative polysaccharide deacetylase [Magnetospira sp. QH-2]
MTAPIVNAMTIDVEDYFQVQAFANRVSRGDWDSFPTRVVDNTSRALDIYAETNTKATFFTLGWVAERFPQLIRRIVEEGHELASHGWAHFLVTDQSPDEFRDDIRRTKALLEDTGGQAVTGYRAATFSIGRNNLWAFDVLAEEGYAYSSSIYPINHDLYGMPEAPRFLFQPTDAAISEIPLTTLRVGSRNLPCSGGGYFRLLPYAVSRQAMRRVNGNDGQSCIFYYHPWELDPDQPRMDGLSAKSKFRHYLNLHRMEHRLRRLLADFKWDRMDRVFMADPQPNAAHKSV